MDLKELKKMIAEEYAAFNNRKNKMYEQAPPMPTVNVSAADVDAEGDEDAEKTLRDIYDMLKDYFEGGKDAADDVEVDTADDTDDAEDIEEGMHYDEDEKEKIKEAHCYGEDGKPMPEGHCYEEDGKLKEGYSKNNKILVERFKKLANIIK